MGTYLCRQAQQAERVSSHRTSEAQNLFKTVNLGSLNKQTSMNNSRGRQYFPCQYLGKGSYGTSLEVFLKQKKQQKFVQKITKVDWLKQNFLFVQSSLFKELNSSPSFVKVLYLCLPGKKMYIISQKQKFGNLYNFMKKNPKLMQYHIIKQLSIRIILILQKLHSRNIIYRSLRPENILFVDKFGQFKLTQLLFSKVCENATAFIGPASYTPPQVYKDNSTGYNQSVDFWMLGVMIYELIVGHTPFEAANLTQIRDNVLNFSPESLKFPEQTMICEDLIDFISNLLQQNPEARIGLNEIKRHRFFEGESWNEDRESRGLFSIRTLGEKQESMGANRIIFSNSTGKQNCFNEQFLQISYDQRSLFHSI